jgi:hypothetical protein
VLEVLVLIALTDFDFPKIVLCRVAIRAKIVRQRMPKRGGVLWIFGEAHLCFDKIERLHQLARFDANTATVTACTGLTVPGELAVNRGEV